MPTVNVREADMNFYFSKLDNVTMIDTLNSRPGGNHSVPDPEVKSHFTKFVKEFMDDMMPKFQERFD